MRVPGVTGVLLGGSRATFYSNSGSEATMDAEEPDIDDAVSVNATDLPANSPSDDLSHAVNPGTEDGLTLPPDAVRSLPVYTDGPA